MTYAILSGNTITASGEASDLWPDTSFNRKGPNPDYLAQFNAVKVRSDAPFDPLTQILESCAPYLLNGEVFNTIAAPIPLLAPDWPGFQAELLQSATFAAARIGARQIVESEIPTAEGVRLERLLRASTALSAMDAAVLGAATDQSPFVRAWLNLRQASLVSPEVAIGMTQIATAHHLPADLIRALGAPEQ